MTAYEWRISDWSSDVCSSDLKADLSAPVFAAMARTPSLYGLSAVDALAFADIARIAALRAFSTAIGDDGTGVTSYIDLRTDMISPSGKQQALQRLTGWPAAQIDAASGYLNVHLSSWQGIDTRSEEHTSELQSLMRISYAVFCLKKKK